MASVHDLTPVSSASPSADEADAYGHDHDEYGGTLDASYESGESGRQHRWTPAAAARATAAAAATTAATTAAGGTAAEAAPYDWSKLQGLDDASDAEADELFSPLPRQPQKPVPPTHAPTAHAAASSVAAYRQDEPDDDAGAAVDIDLFQLSRSLLRGGSAPEDRDDDDDDLVGKSLLSLINKHKAQVQASAVHRPPAVQPRPAAGYLASPDGDEGDDDDGDRELRYQDDDDDDEEVMSMPEFHAPERPRQPKAWSAQAASAPVDDAEADAMLQPEYLAQVLHALEEIRSRSNTVVSDAPPPDATRLKPARKKRNTTKEKPKVDNRRPFGAGPGKPRIAQVARGRSQTRSKSNPRSAPTESDEAPVSLSPEMRANIRRARSVTRVQHPLCTSRPSTQVITPDYRVFDAQLRARERIKEKRGSLKDSKSLTSQVDRGTTATGPSAIAAPAAPVAPSGRSAVSGWSARDMDEDHATQFSQPLNMSQVHSEVWHRDSASQSSKPYGPAPVLSAVDYKRTASFVAQQRATALTAQFRVAPAAPLVTPAPVIVKLALADVIAAGKLTDHRTSGADTTAQVDQELPFAHSQQLRADDLSAMSPPPVTRAPVVRSRIDLSLLTPRPVPPPQPQPKPHAQPQPQPQPPPQPQPLPLPAPAGGSSVGSLEDDESYMTTSAPVSTALPAPTLANIVTYPVSSGSVATSAAVPQEHVPWAVESTHVIKSAWTQHRHSAQNGNGNGHPTMTVAALPAPPSPSVDHSMRTIGTQTSEPPSPAVSSVSAPVAPPVTVQSVAVHTSSVPLSASTSNVAPVSKPRLFSGLLTEQLMQQTGFLAGSEAPRASFGLASLSQATTNAHLHATPSKPGASDTAPFASSFTTVVYTPVRPLTMSSLKTGAPPPTAAGLSSSVAPFATAAPASTRKPVHASGWWESVSVPHENHFDIGPGDDFSLGLRFLPTSPPQQHFKYGASRA